jgi:hypothetical protein
MKELMGMLVLLMVAHSSFAANGSGHKIKAPADIDLIRSLDSYYANNTAYQNCLGELLGGRPISFPVAYKDRLIAASFAEELITECKVSGQLRENVDAAPESNGNSGPGWCMNAPNCDGASGMHVDDVSQCLPENRSFKPDHGKCIILR